MRRVFVAVVVPVLFFVVLVAIFRVLPPICGMSLRMVAVVITLLASQSVPGCDRVVIAGGQPQKKIVGGA